MSNLPKTLAEHFNPLHEMFRELSAQADRVWIEGGMTWSVEYQLRMARTYTIDSTYVSCSKQMPQGHHLQGHKHFWAKLIWRAQGDCGNLMDIASGFEWDEEENRLIVERHEQAQKLITFFETSGANLVHMSFIDDDISLSVKCVSLFGHHALIHNIFWSVD